MNKAASAKAEYREFYYRNRHGLRLFARDYQPQAGNSAMPLVCLPGLSRNSADFHLLATMLQAHSKNPRRVIAFDYRGRGLSDYDDDWQRYDVRIEAADISEGLTALDIERADFLGTSRGGLIIMALAAVRPALLGHIILNDIGPRIEQIGLLRIRAYLSGLRELDTWQDVHHAFRGPMKEGFPAASEADYLDFIQGLFSDEGGKPKPLFDDRLLTPIREMDLNQSLPELWPQFAALRKNRLDILRGENSDLLSEETVEKMRQLHPEAGFYTIPGHAHAPLTNSPQVAELIATLLEQ